MNRVAKALEREFRPGYRAQIKRGNDYIAIDPHGKPVRDAQGVIIMFGGGDGSDALRSSRRRLQLAGAIAAPVLHKRTEPVPKRKPSGRNAIMISQEILRDPNAKPRERTLAKEFLNQFDVNLKLRSLATGLSSRIYELDPTSS